MCAFVDGTGARVRGVPLAESSEQQCRTRFVAGKPKDKTERGRRGTNSAEGHVEFPTRRERGPVSRFRTASEPAEPRTAHFDLSTGTLGLLSRIRMRP